nr:MAG TPA: STRUCTURAL MAINTENANCE OF CHROMOSOMES PROTEIN [Caudoviricetes sp.]
MKITKIKIKNLFGIKEYEADGSNKELSGKNGTGKTSVIDAIRYALTNKSDRQYIVRNGESEGEIIIETDTGLLLDRKARIGMADYKSIKQNGVPVGSPESFLKDIVTTLQLSPVDFMNLDTKKQNSMLLDLIQYEWDMNTIREWFGEIPTGINYEQNILAVLNDIQAENGDYYMTRQDINREARAKKSVIEEIANEIPVEYNLEYWKSINLGELYTKVEKIRKANSEIEKAKIMVEGQANKLRSFEADREIKLASLDREMAAESNNIDSELARLKERIIALEKEKESLNTKKADRTRLIESEFEKEKAQYLSNIEAYLGLADKEIMPIDSLAEEAETAERMKSYINEYERMIGLQEELEVLNEKSKKLTEKIELARNLPAVILEKAELPIANLTVKDGIPLINGLPISNLSEGEKLDLCIDIAISKPNGLQIILIDGIEKLATEMRENLYKKCKEKGLQFIATRTTDDNELTVIEV